jgi:hypothetical protein
MTTRVTTLKKLRNFGLLAPGSQIYEFDYVSLEMRVAAVVGYGDFVCGSDSMLRPISLEENAAIEAAIRDIRKLIQKACSIVRRATGLCVHADAWRYSDRLELALAHLVAANQILRNASTGWVALNQLRALNSALLVFKEYESVRVFLQTTAEQRAALDTGLRLLLSE